MGRWLKLGVNFGMLITLLLVTTPRTTEAQTQVSFEFEGTYSQISQNVDTFKSFLVADIVVAFNFSQTEISSMQVTATISGSIKVTFTLNIDTANNAKIKSRTELEQSLRTGNYVFVFLEVVYRVNSTTVSIVLSVWDIWHQFVPEIIIALLCGLLAIAIFTVSIQLLCMNKRKKKVRDVEVPMNNLPAGSATSPYRDNGGFFMDETNTAGQRSHTPKSSIASSRYAHVQDRDTLYDKLIHGNYAVPSKYMYNFL